MLKKVEEFILSRPLARLSTVTPAGLPHSIPICFALSGLDTIYTPIDSKPKTSSKKTLTRINNIVNNDEVVVLFDRYSEDWNELGYVMVRGKARTPLLTGVQITFNNTQCRELGKVCFLG